MKLITVSNGATTNAWRDEAAKIADGEWYHPLPTDDPTVAYVLDQVMATIPETYTDHPVVFVRVEEAEEPEEAA